MAEDLHKRFGILLPQVLSILPTHLSNYLLYQYGLIGSWTFCDKDFYLISLKNIGLLPLGKLFLIILNFLSSFFL